MSDLHESLHAARVMDCLRERIAQAGGWLPFDEYMQIALYEPGLGYYSAGAHKLGVAGDFTTAPEISPLFGQCLATQCRQVLEAQGGGDIVEPGAGSGKLAFDVLTALAAQNALPHRYRILEISADLRQRQQQRLATLPADISSRVEWLDAPPAGSWRGVLLANEVLDALPCECFAWRGDALFERGVALDAGNGLIWEEREARPTLRAEVERIRAETGAFWPSPYVSEICTRVGPWIASVTAQMTAGVVLFIDYGLPRREYFHPQRDTGTLRAHFRQRAQGDPFAHPGLQDLTAWVDFTRVAEAADTAGLEVLGFATQAAMLLALGIEAEVAAAADERTRLQRASEARRLLMPEEMGEIFKVMALGRGIDIDLAGLMHQDMRARL